MSVDLNIPVSDVDSFIGTDTNQFDQMKLYSATSRGGTYTLVTTITLVAGDTLYTYSDTAGTTSTWYKITFYNSVTTNETSINEVEPFPAERDLFTRKELRQKVIRNLSGKVLTPSDFAAQSVTSLALIDTAADAEYYEGWHIYRPDSATSADNDRRCSAYTPATGVLTHGGSAYSDTTVGSEVIEISPLDIDYDVLIDKINLGLQDTRWLHRWEMGAISGTNQYNLPHFVEGPEYVQDIWRRQGSTTGSYQWTLLGANQGWAKVRGSDFECVLDISPSFGDNDVFALEVWRPGEPLESETDFTRVPAPWAEAVCTLAVLEYVASQQILRHGDTKLGVIIGGWKERARKAARRYGPTPMMKLQLPQPMRGLPAV